MRGWSESMLDDFASEHGGSRAAASAVEDHFGLLLPSDYRQFMEGRDGGEGFIGGHYLILWRMEELIEFHRQYEVEDYAPGLLLFGSSGGGEAFAFDRRDSAMRIVMVPFVGLCLDDAVPIAKNFDEFLTSLENADT